jgi:urease accessory protein
MTQTSIPRASLAASLAFASAAAFAHVGHGTTGSGGFLDGMLHPVTGLDHVAAMVAVGLWGAQLGAPAIWLLPITFPLVMALGAFAGVIGIPLPGVVLGVALSGVVLGAMVALARRPPLWLAALLVAAFAVFHGHTHGTALPLSGVPLAYGAGFVIATGLLHLAGIAIGVLNRWPAGARAIRAGGALIAATGVVFLGLHLRALGG